MEFLVPRIPVHLLFSYISVVVTAGLGILVLATKRRQATPSFIALAATMALWQFAKLAKNGGIPFWSLGSQEFWSNLSFVGATFVYPSLFILAIQLSGRKMRYWRPAMAAAVLSAILMVILFMNGVLTEGLRLDTYGYFNRPKLAYLSYMLLYTAFMVWGIVLLWRKPPERLAIPYPSRLLFWAATLGFGFGSLEFYSIIVHPIYPLADLSSAFYSAVFYWAIFRYNYMGGRSLLKWFLLRCAAFFAAFAVALSALFAFMHLAPWFEQPWVPAVLVALVLSAMVPLLYQAFNQIRQHYFPAEYSGRDLLLEASAIASTSTNPIEMAERVLAELERTFNFPRTALVLFRSCRPSETPPHVITHNLHIAQSHLHVLNREYQGAISRRELLDSLRQLNQPNSERKRELVNDYRLLRRSSADILVPSSSEEGLELVLVAEEGRYRTEDWQSTAPMLEGVCKLLADHLYLRRITETRVQERHLGDLGLMAAGLAHEIKNPLEGIYGAAQILQEEAKGNPRFVDMVLKDSMRLNDIVQAFLKFARPYPIQLQPIDLQGFLDAFAKQQPGLIQTGGTATPLVQADPNGLQQILVNLTQNALRIQPAGIPIRITMQTQGSFVEILVEDDGPGIAPEQSQHLFKPFFTTFAKGNGLGLALSRKIANAMGGDLYFVPKEKGACFAVRLQAM